MCGYHPERRPWLREGQQERGDEHDGESEATTSDSGDGFAPPRFEPVHEGSYCWHAGFGGGMYFVMSEDVLPVYEHGIREVVEEVAETGRGVTFGVAQGDFKFTTRSSRSGAFHVT